MEFSLYLCFLAKSLLVKFLVKFLDVTLYVNLIGFHSFASVNIHICGINGSIFCLRWLKSLFFFRSLKNCKTWVFDINFILIPACIPEKKTLYRQTEAGQRSDPTRVPFFLVLVRNPKNRCFGITFLFRIEDFIFQVGEFASFVFFTTTTATCLLVPFSSFVRRRLQNYSARSSYRMFPHGCTFCPLVSKAIFYQNKKIWAFNVT